MLKLRSFLQATRPLIAKSITSNSNAFHLKQISPILQPSYLYSTKLFYTTPLRNKKNFSSNSSTSETTQETKKRWYGKGIIRASLLSLLGLTGVAVGTSLYIFPEWRKNVKNGIISTGRFLRSARVAAIIAFDYKWTLMFSKNKENDLREAHIRTGERLKKLFIRNGGIFIKAGQIMYALDYLLPYEYIIAMKPLLDKNPHRQFSDVEKVFREEFGKEIKEVFEYINETPTSCGSLAQVHQAKYKGHQVAVKVQYPGLREQCIGDVKTIAILIDVVSWLFPEFKLKWLVDEFNANLPKELDFTHEAKNSQRVSHNFNGYPYLHVPKTFWNLTTKRILTMEWIDGVKINDIEGMNKLGLNKNEVARTLADVFSMQIFIHGFVHADPHPGNIFVRKRQGTKQPQIVLLDNGLYRDYDDHFRITYCRLWLAVLKGDMDKIKDYSLKLAGTGSYQIFAGMLTARSWDSISKSDLNAHTLTDSEVKHLQNEAQQHAAEITSILQAVPKELLLLFKTNDTLRHIYRELRTNINAMSIYMRYCLKSVNQWELYNDPSASNRLRAFKEYITLNIELAAIDWYLWLRWLFTGKQTLL